MNKVICITNKIWSRNEAERILASQRALTPNAFIFEVKKLHKKRKTYDKWYYIVRPIRKTDEGLNDFVLNLKSKTFHKNLQRIR